MKSYKKLLWAYPIIMLLVSMTMMNVTLASPTTYIYMDPSVKNAIGQSVGYQFPININVSQAPSTYAWEVHLSWDPNALEFFYKSEGEFLKRLPTNYPTIFSTYPVTFAEANVKGEVKIGCTLQPWPNGTDATWASGNGRLVRLGFKVKALGRSTLINLFDTVLLDHLEAGAPAPTTYPNKDCFFYNVSPSHDISGRPSYISVINASVYVGEVAKINVTALNEGTVDESITLNVYANNTLLIGTASLSVNGTGSFENRSSTYTVPWNTAGFAEGIYNITAYVPPVLGEVDTADNRFVGEQLVRILPLGDIDRDGSVTLNDLTLFASAYGSTPTSSNWNLYADTNKDNIISVQDLFKLGRNYGRKT